VNSAIGRLLAKGPPQLLPARELVAFTLASRTLLVPFRVALPAITLLMHCRGPRKDDAVTLPLTRRRSAVGRCQRLGFTVPFTVAAILTPVLFVPGDSIARSVFHEQPVKFAATEVTGLASVPASDRPTAAQATIVHQVFDIMVIIGSPRVWVPGARRTAPGREPGNP
jgi:hypothetical protein